MGKATVPLAEKPYLRIREAARLYSKSPTTIYEAIYSGELEHIAQGTRYVLKRSALDDWMDRGAPK